MEEFVAKLKEGTKIIIKGKEYIVKSKTWYSLEEDLTASYVKCELSDNKFLIVIPDDELMYIGITTENLKYERISDDTIKYNGIILNKTGGGHQFIKKIEFGNEDEVEGKCIFEDYESDKYVISPGILPEKGNKSADLYAEKFTLEDVEVVEI